MHVMIDCETLGIRPGCAIVSLGAVEFSFDGIGRRFYRVITQSSCLEAGLVTESATLAWWEKQNEDARSILTSNIAMPLGIALTEFSRWYQQGFLAWGNGADFDLPIVAEAYRRCGLGAAPWPTYGGRCYRTLKNLRPDVKIVTKGVRHNAVDDAANQAMHAIALLKAIA
jgi:DNA polymerase III epsilon subunit-like protein